MQVLFPYTSFYHNRVLIWNFELCLWNATDDSKKVGHLLSLDGAKERLHLFKASLLEEGSFDPIVDGCEGVFHTASPVLVSVTDPQVLPILLVSWPNLIMCRNFGLHQCRSGLLALCSDIRQRKWHYLSYLQESFRSVISFLLPIYLVWGNVTNVTLHYKFAVSFSS